MRTSLLSLVVCSVAFGCSGKAQSIPAGAAGAMSDAGSAGEASGGSDALGGAAGEGGLGSATQSGAPNAGATNDEIASVAVGGFDSIPAPGGVEVVAGCFVATAVHPPEPPFAAPATVWARVSRLVFDRQVEPLAPLPSETTLAWAGEVALRAFDTAQAEPGGAQGLRRFLTSWLGVDRNAIFEQDWPSLVAGPVDAPRVLLTTPLFESGRVGVFSEVAFLTSHPTIVQRGVAVLWALRAHSLPPEPPGIPRVDPAPGQTRRAALLEHQSTPSCASCHQLTDALGFSLEHFDELGRYRDFDAGVHVDSSGTVPVFLSDDPRAAFFSGIEDLVAIVGAQCATAVAFAHLSYADALSAAQIAQESPSLPPGVPPSLPPKAPQPQDPLKKTDDEGSVIVSFLVHGNNYRALLKALAQSRPFLQ